MRQGLPMEVVTRRGSAAGAAGGSWQLTRLGVDKVMAHGRANSKFSAPSSIKIGRRSPLGRVASGHSEDDEEGTMCKRAQGHDRADWRRCAVCAGWLALTMAMGAAPVVAQSAMELRANLTVQDVPLAEALRRLQQSANVALVYSPDLLPPGVRVSCECQDLTVEQALARLLRGTDLAATSRGRQVRIVPIGREGTTDAGTGVVMGTVVGPDGVPVVNALVQVVGGPGALSDATGHFIVVGVPSGLRQIVVTCLGWRSETVDEVQVVAADTTRVRVNMIWEVIPLPEVLVSPGAFGLLEEVAPGTVRALTREEIETRPQIGEDIFRAVQRLPGVASDDISTRLNIRGGSDREVLVRLDGLELYEPYHLKDWDGVLGIVDLNAVGGVEVVVGGFGPEFGNKLTGVFDMTSRTSVGEPVTSVGVSISNLTFMSRGGFNEDRGSWLVSARRGFMDLVMSLVGEGNRFSPEYYDVFAKVRYQVAPHHVVSIHALRAGDTFLLRETPSEGPDTVDLSSDWKSDYGWATWDADVGASVSARTTGWVGRVTRSRAGFIDDPGETPLRVRVEDERVFTFGGLRSDLGVEITPDALLRVGGEVKQSGADFTYLGRAWRPFVTPEHTRGIRMDSTDVELAPTSTAASTYAALRLRPLPNWTAEAGLRYDYISHTDDKDVSPRLLTALEVTPGTTLRASWGRYRQPHGLQELEVGDGETTYRASESANQVALGFERRARGGLGLRVEAYRRTIGNPHPRYLNAEQELVVFPELAGDRVRIDPTRSRARGLEVLLEQRSGPRWTWAASYTLAQAEDEVGGAWVPRRFDQRHTVSLFTAYRPAPDWDVSVSWQYHTGWPATAWTYEVETLDDGWNHWTRIFGPMRGIRLPAYHRLDVRVSRRFQVRGNTLDAFVDLFNVYDRLNLGSFDYVGSYDRGTVTVWQHPGQELLPFLPTFGLRYEF